jgi:hypothetical protein
VYRFINSPHPFALSVALRRSRRGTAVDCSCFDKPLS